jgi:hypothetical protein
MSALIALDSPARAQFQGSGTGNYAPNYYNRNTQPLSPYLNLLRGGNTAANYFYGVRPGTMSGGFGQPYGAASSLGRQTFFPQVDTLYDLENLNPADGLRPTGHPFGYNNTLNYFGAGLGTGMGNPRNQNQSPMSSRKSGTTTGR